jgi:hypothetical protein
MDSVPRKIERPRIVGFQRRLHNHFAACQSVFYLAPRLHEIGGKKEHGCLACEDSGAVYRDFIKQTRNQKGSAEVNPLTLDSNSGRCERIRTFDPLHPMQVRYQAAPHTELTEIIPVR